MFARLTTALKQVLLRARNLSVALWRRFRILPRWGQALAIAGLLVLFWGISALLSGTPATTTPAIRAVSLRSVGELSGSVSGASIVGNVRARSEAELRAEAGGTVRSVNTVVGAFVPAGFVLAELENSSERAQVTQAEGAYDAALAARASVSPVDVASGARNAYRDAFDTLDILLETQVDQLFGGPTPVGPDLLINPTGSDPAELSKERKRIAALMETERARLAGAAATDPRELLDGIEPLARQIAAFVDAVSEAANRTNSNASATQITAITTARTQVTGVLSSLTAAQATLRSGATGSTASVDASVKSALGTLRLAEASLEKTRIRAPIGGTVNYLPIRVGDYVGNLDHVATVAQNGALEIVAFASEEAVASLSAGAKVQIEDQYEGTVTSIAPALDPVTKQIELHVAVGIESGLVNGQSVRLTLPGTVPTTETTEGPVLLPLSAVKLSAGNRVVFMLREDGRLEALPVQIGEVVGERIQILSPLPADLRIVSDARGLSDGQQVRVAEDN